MQYERARRCSLLSLNPSKMMTVDSISLTILTPEKTLLEIMVSKVELPGAKGRFMVLKNHIPLISALVEGSVTYMSDGKEGRVEIRNGFAEINANKVIVCAEV